jgi:predicted nuclease of predicted toxin-antitoxin system
MVRVQDVGLTSTSDLAILAWAAANRRILLTHDRDTVPNFVYDRVRAGQPMPGVFLVNDRMPKGQAVDEILLAVQCLSSEECEDLVTYFPL